jgi:uncharacterized protein YdgA (DUF945 family)
MNKLLIAAAVALVLLLLGLPAVVASVTEARVRERVAAIDATSTAAAEVTAFDRGWFHSKANIVLSLVPDPAQLGNVPPGVLGVSSAPPPLPLAIEFAHGPIAVLDGVYFGWSKWIARLDTEASGVTELQQTLGVPYVFEFRGRTGFGGNLAFDADAPAFELPVDEALVTFSGATIDGTFDGGRDLEARMHIPAVDFTSPTGTFLVNNLRASADNEIVSRYVMPGMATLSIERISISDAFQGGMPVFEVANLAVSSDTTLDASGALLDSRMVYGLDSMRMAESEVTSATIEMSVRNLDVAALEAYSAAVDDPANPVDPMTALGPHLERALRAGPSLALDPIRFALDAEPFDGRVQVSTNVARLPQAGTISLDNPLFLLGLVDTTANVRMSKALAQNLAELMARVQLGSDGSVPADELEYLAEAQAGLTLTLLVGQGVLVEDGEAYVSSLDFSDGALTLNGNALPFGLP